MVSGQTPSPGRQRIGFSLEIETENVEPIRFRKRRRQRIGFSLEIETTITTSIEFVATISRQRIGFSLEIETLHGY